MIPSNKLDSFRIAEFETGEKGYGLDGMQAAIDIIACTMIRLLPIARRTGRPSEALTQKEVICIWGGPAYPEYLDEIVKLTMDVTDDCDRRGDVDDIALAHQDFLGLLAYFSKKGLSEQLLVAQPFDARIEIEWRHPWMTEGSVDEDGGRGRKRPRGWVGLTTGWRLAGHWHH